MKRLKVFAIWGISITIFCVNAQEKRVWVNVDNLHYPYVDQILHALKDYGNVNRPSSVPDSVEQYTCTTVLAEEEVNNLDWMTGSKFPETFTKENRRIRVQYNENDNKDHGEKIVLEKYINGLITEMQTDSKQKDYNTYPIVIMYSYNIPCSIADHTCAQKLKDDKAKRAGTPTEYSMIVGFTLFFQFRGNLDRNIQNRQQSFKELTEKNIKVLMTFDMYKDIQFASLVLQDKHIYGEVAFQSIMFDWLVKQPIVSSCIARNPQDIDWENVKRVVTFSIDSMFYKCFRKARNYRNTGVWEKSRLKKCLREWIEDNIGNDCKDFGSKEVWTYLLEATIKQGRRLATYIAEPFAYDPKSMFPTWRSALKAQDPITPDDYLRNSPLLLCRKPSDPGSFCTNMKKDQTKRVTEFEDKSPPRKISKLEMVKTLDKPGHSRDLL